jgi:hypothetical protein
LPSLSPPFTITAIITDGSAVVSGGISTTINDEGGTGVSVGEGVMFGKVAVRDWESVGEVHGISSLWREY